MKTLSIDSISSIFAGALSEIIAKTTGLTFDISPPEENYGFDEMTGFINLAGKNHGMVFISAKEEAIRLICSLMTGVSKSEITGKDIEDTLCELVNMTAGSARLRFNTAEQTYTLSPPFLIRGENMSFITKKRVNVISMVLGNEEISIKLKIVFY